MKFEEISIGSTHKQKFQVTDKMIRDFAFITGDTNPLHVDDEFAKATIFGKRISHGMLVASLISKVLGMDFPGPGTIFISQKVKFLKPVFVDEFVEVIVEVLEKKEEKKRIIIKTDIYNTKGEMVISGEAEVMKKD